MNFILLELLSVCVAVIVLQAEAGGNISDSASANRPNLVSRVAVLSSRSGCLKISWDKVNVTEHGVSVEYTVRYTINTKVPVQDWPSKKVTNSETTILDNLKPFTAYVILLQLRVKGIKTPWPAFIPVRASPQCVGTTRDTGSSELKMAATSSKRGTLLISWGTPQEEAIYGLEHVVRYTTDTYLPVSSWQIKTVQDDQFTTLEGLKPSTVYYVLLEARVVDGEASWSLFMHVRATDREFHWEVSSISGTLLSVTPKKEGYFEGELVNFHCPLGYKVIGSPVLKCAYAGLDGELPVCVGVSELFLLQKLNSRLNDLESEIKKVTAGKCGVGPKYTMSAIKCFD